jgi:hypothetical protein
MVRGREGGIGDVERKRDDIGGVGMGVSDLSDLIEGATMRAGVVGREPPATDALRE